MSKKRYALGNRWMGVLLLISILFSIMPITAFAEATFNMNNPTIDQERVSLTGKLLASTTAVSGAVITLTVKDQATGAIVYIDNVATQADGSFNFSFVMDDNALTGWYVAKAAYRGTTSIGTLRYYYVTPQDAVPILNSLNSAPNATALGTILDTNKTLLIRSELISLYEGSLLGTAGRAKVYDMIAARRPYAGIDDVRQATQESIPVALLNIAQNINEVVNTLNTYQIYLGISNYTTYNNLSSSYRDIVYQNVLNDDYISFNAFNAAFRSYVEAQRALEFVAITTKPTLSITFPVTTLNAGQVASSPVTLNTNGKKAVGAVITLQYDATVLKEIRTVDVRFVSGISGTIDVSVSGKIVLTIPNGAEKSISKVCDVDFALSNAGSHTSTSVTGNAVVIYDDAGVNRELSTQAVTVSINFTQKSASTSGGGGGGTVVAPITTPAPSSTPVVTATPLPSTSTFVDIENVLWAKESIEALAAKGIIRGMDDKHFEPQGIVTREQFVKMIVLAFDLYDVQAKSTFKDIDDSSWFYSYVGSAQKANLLTDICDQNFGVGADITREEMATIALRAAKVAKAALQTVNSQTSFKDQSLMASYAVEGIYEMQKAGIINGMGDGIFAPKGTSTRAMAAKIIHGLLKAKN